MAEYFLPLVARKEIADKTWAFWFDISKTDFRFIAGQNADFGMGEVRTFSIASSPNNHDTIMIASRRLDGSDFKRNLMTMPLGTKLRVQGPLGDFVLPKKTDRPIVMIAGGIGITPMYSMLQWVTEEHLPYKITLVFANSSRERAAFINEIEKMPITLMPIYGRFSTLPTIPEARYYLAGPPGMVAAARTILDEGGVDEDNIKTEEFSGY